MLQIVRCTYPFVSVQTKNANKWSSCELGTAVSIAILATAGSARIVFVFSNRLICIAKKQCRCKKLN